MSNAETNETQGRAAPYVLFIVLAAGVLLIVGTSRNPAEKVKQPEPMPSAEKPIELTSSQGKVVVGSPIRHKNLTVFPIRSSKQLDADPFITLDEGLKSGEVEVREIKGNGTVSRVEFVNNSGRPLYVMPGETLLGGKQDRTIAEETIVPPTGKRFLVSVLCIEHGRWRKRLSTLTTDFLISGNDISPKEAKRLSKLAEGGQFVATMGCLNREGRFRLYAKLGQQAVWDAVADANNKSGVDPQTGTYTASFIDERIKTKLKEYLESLREPVLQHDRVVGVVVAIEGKPVAADVFGSTPLFRKIWPKLLMGFAIDATSTGGEFWSECTIQDAAAFLKRTNETPLRDVERKNGLILRNRVDGRRGSFSASDENGNVIHKGNFEP